MQTFDRITHDPRVMSGKACIRGMRVTVSMILGQLAGGVSIEDLLFDYPYLEREDILQALSYGSWLAQEREILPLIDISPGSHISPSHLA